MSKKPTNVHLKNHLFKSKNADECEQSAYMLLADVARILYRRLRRGSERIGLKPGYRHILYHLVRGDEGSTQQTLVKHTRLSAPTISVSLTRMEAEGLVTRKPDPEDLRSMRVFLTEKGRAIDAAMQESLIAVEKEFMQSLSEDELDKLRQLLIKARENLVNRNEQQKKFESTEKQ